MIAEQYLLKVLHTPHVSEKASLVMKKNNAIVLKVSKNAKKSEIKAAAEKFFEIEVSKVRTLIVKGKVKRHNRYVGRRSDWKKAYITLKKGQSLDFISDTTE
jgi:large subunit ribosomal protein L23